MLLIESTFELAKLSEEEIKTRSRIKNFVIDSRQVKKNSVFIALKGNNLDGNDFIYDALEKGAKVKTVGGLFGTITGVKDDCFVIRISENVKVEMAKDSISTKVD